MDGLVSNYLPVSRPPLSFQARIAKIETVLHMLRQCDPLVTKVHGKARNLAARRLTYPLVFPPMVILAEYELVTLSMACKKINFNNYICRGRPFLI